MLHNMPPKEIPMDHHGEDLAVEDFYFPKTDKEAQNALVKSIIQPIAEQLNLLNIDKIATEARLKDLNKKICEKESLIRKAWEPFCTGSDVNELKFGDFTIKMEDVLNISIEDNDAVIDWLLKNGYQDVLKYQVHHQTFKSIGKELYNNKENSTLIPGANYSNFSKIKIKSNL